MGLHCFPSCNKFGHKGFAAYLLPSSSNQERFCRVRARQVAFVSVDWEVSNFKGFRTCLGSHCFPSLRKFGHNGLAVCLLPSSWNQELFSRERARQCAFVSVDWEERLFQRLSFFWSPCFGSLYRPFLRKFGHKGLAICLLPSSLNQ